MENKNQNNNQFSHLPLYPNEINTQSVENKECENQSNTHTNSCNNLHQNNNLNSNQNNIFQNGMQNPLMSLLLSSFAKNNPDMSSLLTLLNKNQPDEQNSQKALMQMLSQGIGSKKKENVSTDNVIEKHFPSNEIID